MSTVFDDFLAGDGKAILVYDLPDSIYYAEKRFMSKHALDKFADNARKYKYELDLEPVHDSATLRFGRAFHTLILEPEKFNDQFIQMPANVKVKSGKIWEEFCAENVGNRDVLTAEEMEKLQGMRDAILAHPKAKDLLIDQPGNSEVTAIWRSDEGRPCKAKIDRLLSEKNIVVDLKTRASAAPDTFARAVQNFRYDVQGAFYCDAVAKAKETTGWRFALVAIEKLPPYACAVYYLDNWMRLGRDTYKRDFVKFLEAEKTDTWKDYEVENDILPVPKWAETARGFPNGLPSMTKIPY